MEIDHATREDFITMLGEPPPYTFRGVVIRDNGKPVAIGGVMRAHGKQVVFTEFSGPVNKRCLILAWRKIRGIMASMHTTIYAIRDENQPTSESFLRHFGFEKFLDSDHGEIYRWQ